MYINCFVCLCLGVGWEGGGSVCLCKRLHGEAGIQICQETFMRRMIFGFSDFFGQSCPIKIMLFNREVREREGRQGRREMR